MTTTEAPAVAYMMPCFRPISRITDHHRDRVLVLDTVVFMDRGVLVWVEDDSLCVMGFDREVSRFPGRWETLS